MKKSNLLADLVLAVCFILMICQNLSKGMTMLAAAYGYALVFLVWIFFVRDFGGRASFRKKSFFWLIGLGIVIAVLVQFLKPSYENERFLTLFMIAAVIGIAFLYNFRIFANRT